MRRRRLTWTAPSSSLTARTPSSAKYRCPTSIASAVTAEECSPISSRPGQKSSGAGPGDSDAAPAALAAGGGCESLTGVPCGEAAVLAAAGSAAGAGASSVGCDRKSEKSTMASSSSSSSAIIAARAAAPRCGRRGHRSAAATARTGFWNDPVFQDLGTGKTMFHIDPNLYLGTLF